MEKAQPPRNYGSLSAPESHDTQGYQEAGGYSGQAEYAQPENESTPILPQEPVTFAVWFYDAQRNKTQLSSLAAATLIFISGGMSFAWSAGFAPNDENSLDDAAKHMQVCWFVAVIIGACIAAVFIERLSKRVFNFIASILIIAKGILFVLAPEGVAAIIIARYCDGIAFGLTVIPAIVAGSEVSVKRLRGVVLSTEQIGLAIGITLQIIYTTFWESTWKLELNQMHGVLALGYGILAFICSLILTIESPIFHLRKNNETEAIDVLRKLQTPHVVTETHDLLNENKHLMQEDNARGRTINISTGLVPMVKMCLFRAFVTMSFSVPLSSMLVMAATFSNNEWAVNTYALMRLFGVAVAILTLDSLGRKGLSAFSILVGGGLLIAVGLQFNELSDLGDPDKMGSVLRLLMTFQAFSGLAAPASTCYLGEAFSVSVKAYFILVAVVFEYVIQIIICCAFTGTSGLDAASNYTHVVGALQIVYAISFFVVMPETKQTTLREALAKFKKTVNVGTS